MVFDKDDDDDDVVVDADDDDDDDVVAMKFVKCELQILRSSDTQNNEL